jgi:predicted PurR-regulated permease PerM
MATPPPVRHDAADVLLGSREDDRALPSTRAVLRVVLIVLVVVGILFLIQLLWQPIAWILIAMFFAVALSGPVNILARRMRRGAAITIVYLAVLLVPIALAALIVPPLVRQGVDFVQDFPQYANDIEAWIEGNERLQKLNEDLGLTERLNSLATDAPERIPAAANLLRDLGTGLVNSIFAGFTIFVLSIFMVARGRSWIDAAVDLRSAEHATAIKATLDRIANAVGNYVGGAIVQASIAGITTFIVLSILGVPFAGALAVLVGILDLLPLVGATIGAFLVGLVTVFSDFPTDTIIWVIYALAYQQFENYVIQPQIQKRAVELEPFVVLVSVLFGGALFGVIGALLAIPVAATIQISIQEWWRYRVAQREAALGLTPPPAEPPPPPAPPAAGPEPAPA